MRPLFTSKTGHSIPFGIWQLVLERVVQAPTAIAICQLDSEAHVARFLEWLEWLSKFSFVKTLNYQGLEASSEISKAWEPFWTNNAFSVNAYIRPLSSAEWLFLGECRRFIVIARFPDDYTQPGPGEPRMAENNLEILSRIFGMLHLLTHEGAESLMLHMQFMTRRCVRRFLRRNTRWILELSVAGFRPTFVRSVCITTLQDNPEFLESAPVLPLPAPYAVPHRVPSDNRLDERTGKPILQAMREELKERLCWYDFEA